MLLGITLEVPNLVSYGEKGHETKLNPLQSGTLMCQPKILPINPEINSPPVGLKINLVIDSGDFGSKHVLFQSTTLHFETSSDNIMHNFCTSLSLRTWFSMS